MLPGFTNTHGSHSQFPCRQYIVFVRISNRHDTRGFEFKVHPFKRSHKKPEIRFLVSHIRWEDYEIEIIVKPEKSKFQFGENSLPIWDYAFGDIYTMFNQSNAPGERAEFFHWGCSKNPWSFYSEAFFINSPDRIFLADLGKYFFYSDFRIYFPRILHFFPDFKHISVPQFFWLYFHSLIGKPLGYNLIRFQPVLISFDIYEGLVAVKNNSFCLTAFKCLLSLLGRMAQRCDFTFAFFSFIISRYTLSPISLSLKLYLIAFYM